MPVFRPQGDKKNDLWLVDDSPTFAIFPGGIVGPIDTDVPIFLKVGHPTSFGAEHIRVKHANWLSEHNKTVAEMVHLKLGQSGNIYCTEENSKFKINLQIHPAALLVLNLLDGRLSLPGFYGYQTVMLPAAAGPSSFGNRLPDSDIPAPSGGVFDCKTTRCIQRCPDGLPPGWRNADDACARSSGC